MILRIEYLTQYSGAHPGVSVHDSFHPVSEKATYLTREESTSYASKNRTFSSDGECELIELNKQTNKQQQNNEEFEKEKKTTLGSFLMVPTGFIFMYFSIFIP